MGDDDLLRVHSADLHDHVAQEVGECLESGLYTDLQIRCKDSKLLHGHRLILASASPYLKMLLENNNYDEVQALELPDFPMEIVSLLLEVTYNGIVEATIDNLKELILLAHSLYVKIPISPELLAGLELTLPDIPPFGGKALPKLKQRPAFVPAPMLQMPKVPLPVLKPTIQRQPVEHKNADPMAMAAMMSKSVCRNNDHICPICDSKYTNIGSFKQHMKMHDNDHLKEQRHRLVGELVSACFDPRVSMYTCHICDSHYNHSGNFKQHLLKHERESGSISAMLVAKSKDGTGFDLSDIIQARQSIPPVKVGREPGAPTHTCEFCGRTFNNAGNYKQHLTSHARAQLNIELKNAKERYLMKTNRSNNNGPNHSRPNPNSAVLKCPECKSEFSNVAELEQHISLKHHSMEMSPEPEDYDDDGKKNFSCNQCDTTFDSEVLLKRHKQIQHLNPSRNGPTKEATNGQAHPKANGGVIPTYRCKICGKKFLTMAKLSLHIKVHSNASPEVRKEFPCDICGKKFSRPQHVTRHRLIHTNHQSFSCVKCHTDFVNEESYTFHVKYECQTGETFVPEWNSSGNDMGIGPDFDEEMIEMATPNIILSD